MFKKIWESCKSETYSFFTTVYNNFVNVDDLNFEILNWLNRLFFINETVAKNSDSLSNF